MALTVREDVTMNIQNKGRLLLYAACICYSYYRNLEEICSKLARMVTDTRFVETFPQKGVWRNIINIRKKIIELR